MLNKLPYNYYNGIRSIRRWAIPIINSYIYKKRFRPVLCYLFTNWACNYSCHYCFQSNNKKPGMTIEIAYSSIDWLKSIGCRVVAIMGGEPLMHKDFIIDVINYGSRNGFYMYLPTNGVFMDEEYIDEIGKAGVAAINLAVDCITPRKGLPKGLMNIEPQFRYMVKQQKKYNFTVFFNINICPTNIKDVKMLTEIAHQNKIGAAYHVNEAPISFVDINHFIHQDNNLYITPNEYDEVDELLDWLINKKRQGMVIVNPIQHLMDLKDRIRNKLQPWNCLAGRNGALIRPDGSLAPCFDLITHDYDWGHIWKPKFKEEELKLIKKKCLTTCSSPCFHTLAFYYKLSNQIGWVLKHTRVG